MATWCIVVAGGSGNRFGAPKQFVRLAGAPVIDRALAGARAACDAVVAVVPADVAWDAPEGVLVAPGGETRSDSVRSGLGFVPDDADIIVVHDAARPLASPTLFASVIEAVRAGADAAVPAVPVVDTLKRVEGERVVATVPRDDLVAVQTPQAFRAAALRAAHDASAVDTDDAALVEQRRGTVVIVPGDARNLKVTVPADLELAEALLDAGTGR